MVIRTIRRLPPVAPDEQRMVVAIQDGGHVGQDLVELLAYGRDASVASWARLSLLAATNCIARVIWLDVLDRADPASDVALTGHA